MINKLMTTKYNKIQSRNIKGCDLFDPDKKLTLEEYIDWCKDYAGDTGVIDASNINSLLEPKDIAKFANIFKEHFEVKVIQICREPVYRLFSHLNAIENPGHSLDGLGQNKRLRAVMKYITKPPTMTMDYQMWNHRSKGYRPYMEGNYDGMISNWSKYFDMHVVIMEDLWGDRNDAKKNLSVYLGREIKVLALNLYYPERGPDIPHVHVLKDQWRSEKEYITEKNYKEARERMDWDYVVQGKRPWDKN